LTREGDSFLKRYTAKLFYRIIRKMVDPRIQDVFYRSVCIDLHGHWKMH